MISLWKLHKLQRMQQDLLAAQRHQDQTMLALTKMMLISVSRGILSK